MAQFTFKGVFSDGAKVPGEGLVFASDASGGRAKDPRARVVTWAIQAFNAETLEVVGSIEGVVPGKQTVFRGEAFALQVLLCHTTGSVDCTIDCRPVGKLFQGPPRRKVLNSDVWFPIWQTEKRARVQVHWIRSHMTQARFVEEFGATQLWRWRVNSSVDAQCGRLAAKCWDEEFAQALRATDARVERVLRALADRGAMLLVATSEKRAPIGQGGRPARRVRPNALFQRAGDEPAQKPEDAEPRVERKCRKRQGMNIGNGHKLTRWEWFESLKMANGGRGHGWEDLPKGKGVGLQCRRCGIRLVETRHRRFLDILAAHPCDEPEELTAKYPSVHPSHRLRVRDGRCVCDQCGRGVWYLQNLVPKALQLPCVCALAQGSGAA